MTLSEFYTAQFYAWEYRGRGWMLFDQPVHLEPSFLPYFRHGYSGVQIDDGKRPTWASTLASYFKKEQPPPVIPAHRLDYETVEAYPYSNALNHVGIQLKLAKDRRISPEVMKSCLLMLSSSYDMLSFEIIGTAKEIIIQFVCDTDQENIIATYINAFLPGCSVVRSDTYIENILEYSKATMVVDYGLQQEWMRPISAPKSFSFDPLLGFFAILDALEEEQRAAIQILFQPTCNKWHESMIRSVSAYDGTSFFWDAPEAPQLAQEKSRSPLYAVTIRSFTQADTLENAAQLLQSINHTLITATKSQHNQLIPLAHETYDVERRLDDILLRESHRLGMLLTLDELVGLLHIPSEHIQFKKLYASSRKTKAVPSIAQNKPCILGENTHNGITLPVSIGVEERVKHLYVIGATGTGKSTLLANLILQDIQEGHTTIVFDPHGDLIETIIARVPPQRIDDVVLLDPSDMEFPIGINMLSAKSEIEKEVLSSDLVASFRRHATSWGDQMNSVLGNAIAAILDSSQGGTLHDLRRFLLEKEYRTSFLKSVSDPSIKYYWLKEYPILKTSSIGSIITRLDTFLRPRSIRNMLVQKKALDFEELCNSNKIILCKLSQGLIGTENSYLLGSLILSSIHQAMMRRQQQANRPPVFIYLDEFHHFITPSIKDMLSGVRKYNVGLTLSHQDIQQLQQEDAQLVNAVLGNISTRIVFRVGEQDARKLEDGFTDFTAMDLQNLGRGEAIVRIEQPQFSCSLDTIPLASIDEDSMLTIKNAIVAGSRSRYADTRESVEAAFYSTLDTEKVPRTSTQRPKAKEEQKETKAEEAPSPNMKEKAPPEPVFVKPKEQEAVKPKRDFHSHRYLQTLVKKMAEERGYTATIEQSLVQGGQVDVVLNKDHISIAVEISISTDAEWEVHNISKCLADTFTTVISLCTDVKQLEKIKRKCIETIAPAGLAKVHYFMPDELFAFLDATTTTTPPAQPQETVMKGYRVNVTYDSLTPEEMDQKRKSVTKVVLDSLRKRRKN